MGAVEFDGVACALEPMPLSVVAGSPIISRRHGDWMRQKNCHLRRRNLVRSRHIFVQVVDCSAFSDATAPLFAGWVIPSFSVAPHLESLHSRGDVPSLIRQRTLYPR